MSVKTIHCRDGNFQGPGGAWFDSGKISYFNKTTTDIATNGVLGICLSHIEK